MYPYATRMYSFLLVCIRMSLVFARICTRMYPYVTRICRLIEVSIEYNIFLNKSRDRKMGLLLLSS